MSVVLIIIAAWFTLNALAVVAGIPLCLKRRFAKHDDWIKEGRRLR